MGFTGNWTDPTTGLIYLRARDYDPETGQFLVVDPDLQETNLPYSYAENRPLQVADPLGLQALPNNPANYASSTESGPTEADVICDDWQHQGTEDDGDNWLEQFEDEAGQAGDALTIFQEDLDDPSYSQDAATLIQDAPYAGSAFLAYKYIAGGTLRDQFNYVTQSFNSSNTAYQQDDEELEDEADGDTAEVETESTLETDADLTADLGELAEATELLEFLD
jgi:RHS repeat-associated protein